MLTLMFVAHSVDIMNNILTSILIVRMYILIFISVM